MRENLFYNNIKQFFYCFYCSVFNSFFQLLMKNLNVFDDNFVRFQTMNINLSIESFQFFFSRTIILKNRTI